MKKFGIQLAVLLIVIFGALYLYTSREILNSFLPNTQPLSQRQIKVNQTVINIEVADEPNERARGLAGRDSLTADSGMLFVFPAEGKHRFWMKGMKIPLDFIFVKKGQVVDLIKNVQPPPSGQKDEDLTVYEPVVPIDMMLEVNAGFVDSRNIRVGDKVFLVES